MNPRIKIILITLLILLVIFIFTSIFNIYGVKKNVNYSYTDNMPFGIRNRNRNSYENFQNKESKLKTIPQFYRPFVNLKDDKGNNLNVILVSHPFSRVSGKGSYQDYKDYKDKCIFIGITSYSTYPSIVVNPYDSMNNPKDHVWNYDYKNMFDGWFHCFRNPGEYIKCTNPKSTQLLLSESDFVNYDDFNPDSNITRDFDFIYICPEDEKDKCEDNGWVAFSKNWILAKECITIMCSFGLKGVLVGRKNCSFPPNIEKNLTKTSFLSKDELKTLYNRSKFIFLPNKYDASPRILAEAICMNCRCLVYKDILGGWKYVNKQTGEFFSDKNDIIIGVKTIMLNYNNYSPRKYYLENYGKLNSGKNLKKFLLENYKDRLNLDITNSKYVTLNLNWA